MNNLQGKVKAIPVKEVTEGMQVLCQGLIFKIGKVYDKDRPFIHGLNKKGEIVNKEMHISELKTLVVEYPGDLDSLVQNRLNPVVRAFSPHREIKQLPLKYSQWQSAIDNGEIDSDNIVEFVKEGRGGERKAVIDIAKIIPQKKRIYSEEEVVAKIYSYHNWLSSEDRTEWATTSEWIDYHIGKNIKINLWMKK